MNRQIGVFLALALFGVGAAGAVLTIGPNIESDLQNQAVAELVTLRAGGLSVHADGRDLSIVGTTSADVDLAHIQRVVANVDGVRSVDITGATVIVASLEPPPPTPTPQPTAAPTDVAQVPSAFIKVQYHDNQIVVSGVAPDQRVLTRLLASIATDDRTVVSRVVISAVSLFPNGLTQIERLMVLLGDSDGAIVDGDITLTDGQVLINGTAVDASAISRLDESLQALGFDGAIALTPEDN
jgi:hypothetical protein